MQLDVELLRVAWFASVAWSLVNMPALMLVVRPLLCLLVLASLLNGTCVLVDNLHQFAISKVADGWIARAAVDFVQKVVEFGACW